MAAPAPSPNLMVFRWLFQNVESVVNHYVAMSVSNVIAAITPVAITLFGIYVLMWGFAHLRNQIEEPVTDGVMRLIKIAIVLGLALNVSYYGMFIVQFVMETPTHLITAANHTGPVNGVSTIGQVLDDALNKGYAVGQSAWEKGGFSSIGYLIVAVIIWVSMTFVLLFAAALVLLAKIGSVVMLSIGPVFILMVLFRATQRFFDLWLGQVINLMLTLVLAVLVTSVVIGIIDGFLQDQIAQDSSSGTILMQVLTLGGVGILVLRQVPAIASALAGGIALSTMGMYGATMRGTGGVAGRGLGRAGKFAGRQAANSRAGMAVRNGASRLGQAARSGAASAFRAKNAVKKA